MLSLQEREGLGGVEERQEPGGPQGWSRQGDGALRQEVQGQDRRRTLGEFKDIGDPLDTDIEVPGGLGREGPQGEKARTPGVGHEEEALGIQADTMGVDGGDGLGEAQGGDAVGGDGHRDHHPRIQHDRPDGPGGRGGQGHKSES